MTSLYGCQVHKNLLILLCPARNCNILCFESNWPLFLVYFYMEAIILACWKVPERLSLDMWRRSCLPCISIEQEQISSSNGIVHIIHFPCKYFISFCYLSEECFCLFIHMYAEEFSTSREHAGAYDCIWCHCMLVYFVNISTHDKGIYLNNAALKKSSI